MHNTSDQLPKASARISRGAGVPLAVAAATGAAAAARELVTQEKALAASLRCLCLVAFGIYMCMYYLVHYHVEALVTAQVLELAKRA